MNSILRVSEAMEVYEFQHGEKVVRQGDTDGGGSKALRLARGAGTHFFVVAQGEFCVLKDNVPKCYIGWGDNDHIYVIEL